jgi:FKBP-type peptidyl-prolyl cis-trans isomerase
MAKFVRYKLNPNGSSEYRREGSTISFRTSEGQFEGEPPMEIEIGGEGVVFEAPNSKAVQREKARAEKEAAKEAKAAEKKAAEEKKAADKKAKDEKKAADKAAKAEAKKVPAPTPAPAVN